MSWSVSYSGKLGYVAKSIASFGLALLADKPAGLSDDGERETVNQVFALINQCLQAFDPEKTVTVSTSGHISFDDYDAKTGPRQTVAVSIQPGS